ncbi:MAG: TM2 domain-containing protein [Treponema sp.]|nr:TM2 domain-containing protein [Treponema sp.]
MNKFSKITGLIAFWTSLVDFAGSILILIFQKQIMKSFNSPNLNATVFLFDVLLTKFVLLLIVGLFCYIQKTNNRTRAIISLYFYLLVTILFSNPLVVSVSSMMAGAKGSEYLAAKAVISNALHSILYIFTLVSTLCFYLSTGALIVLNDNQNKEIEAEVSEKSRTKLILFSGFLGIFGIDRFYAKRTGSGIVKLFLGLPITISLLRIIILPFFSNMLESIFMSLSNLFALTHLDSFILSILIAIIPNLPIMIFSIVDFVLCASGKMKDSDNKLIIRW